MSKVKFVRPEDRKMETLFERAQRSPAMMEAMKRFDEQEWYTASFEDFPGSATSGQFYTVWIPPHTVIAATPPPGVEPSTTPSEMFMHILWGELHVGDDVYGPGTSIRWARDEGDPPGGRPQWSAGPQGLMRLVFRPRRPEVLGSSVHGGPPTSS